MAGPPSRLSTAPHIITVDNFRGRCRVRVTLGHMEMRPQVPGYRIGELIATGSSAAVWACSPVDADRDLAVKVVPLPPGDIGEAITLELSALATARGTDDHLVSVLDVVAVTDPGPGVAIVMERLRHGTLTRLVSTRGHLTPGELVTVLTPIALTVARLHDGAVVHGDLSPSNVGFDARGRPVVLDLGVSSVIGTPRVEIYGTPGFVAPEVVAGSPPTASADVYAIAALGWYGLTGEPPPIPAERPPLETLVPEVPEPMRSALERALHPEPDQRGGGRDLATTIYGSAPAAPIEPGEGADPATLLTHRVRELARAGQPEVGEVGDSRRARHAALRTRSRRSHLRALTTLVAALVIGGAGVAAAAVGRGADPTPVAPSVGSPGPTLVAAPDIRRPMDYAALVGGLVTARAAAWSSGDPTDLAASFAEGTAAHADDVERLAQAQRAGHRYDGLQFSVSDILLVTESVDRLGIEATIATSSYAVHSTVADDTRVVERAATSARVELTLVRAEVGWRISAVEPGAT